MQSLRTRSSRSALLVVAAVTSFFVLVGSVLAFLVAIAVRDMTEAATTIDDARASHAASAAVEAFQSRLRATVRDNAVWDDAFKAMASDNAQEWAYENWGSTTEDYPLYDIAIVLRADGSTLTAHKKGEEFDPFEYFGTALPDLAKKAAQSGQEPVSGFVKTADGVVLFGAGSIQPYEETPDVQQAFNTLIFAKVLNSEAIAEIAKTFDLGGLFVVDVPHIQTLNTVLPDIDGKAVSYLEWPSRDPGSRIYYGVKAYLMAAALLLSAFFIAIVATGLFSARGFKRRAQEVHHRAIHDPLSGLLNRAGFLEEVERRLADKEEVELHLLDLDGFKEVNDAWGHAVGDELIKLVAARVTALLPAGASFSRLGGDEFAIAATRSDTRELSSSILEALSRPFEIGGRTIEIGVSIGIVATDASATDPLEFVRRADVALYRAKESGRGQAVAYHAELDLERESRSQFETKLRAAIASNSIRPVYQPLVDAATQEWRGVEVLARWTAETGPVSPEIFIPIAERAGLIDELGLLILASAIDEVGTWQDIAISVNASPIQLRNPNFAANVVALLKAKSFDPRRLTLEITEGVLMANPEQAKRSIANLKAVGVKFALDDFGCGYASIGALREFGFDRMKIDRSLVMGIDNERGAQILNATILLANALDIPVTAEGVETPAQAKALYLSGCDQLQGHLVGKPMEAAEIQKKLLSRAA
ncbi:periplasmic sensor diguanylate cyclase/phosphodiesterase [Neorhizobium sp. R1-B]|uniref:bifunctional diguanylate cyclase/phosphodiesterase n=1 Tax=Neorhizobium TaxID=1525371 RepID=UPI000CF844E9|nr:EAL domain-containing protein [Neorhizobium sp. S3-V5DH]TCV73690.1 periplasmic sensor diguanylate cyclase/phosphodiesterase [Neorhizobium sp. S3-V5DH]TDX85574.1 periplasmic sensor diguanylate cyclase/phosphodiesterase [Neorhizobium sp. R1-B]